MFDDKYLDTYVDIVSPTATAREINFILEQVPLAAGSRILDLACGTGRHTVELAKRGYKVTGLDYSAGFITKAKKAAKLASVEATFLQGDMRSMNYKNKFDAIVNLFTSFGYFASDLDHGLVLKNIARALKNKGLFLIDLNNATRLLTYLTSFEQKVGQGPIKLSRTVTLSNGLEVTTLQQLDVSLMRWKMVRSWQENGEKRSYNTSVRLFTLPEMKHLMAENDLSIEHVWGDFDSTAYNVDSKRMIILARNVA